jgi:hypothetical protein
MKSRGLGFCPGSLFEWASPTQRQRLQSCFHEVKLWITRESKIRWARLLAYVTGTVNPELLLRNEYLAAENRVLRGQIKGRLAAFGRRKGDTRRDRSPPESKRQSAKNRYQPRIVSGLAVAATSPSTIWLNRAVVPMMQTADSRLSDLSLPKMLSGANAFGDAFTRLTFALAQSWRKSALHTWRSSR